MEALEANLQPSLVSDHVMSVSQQSSRVPEPLLAEVMSFRRQQAALTYCNLCNVYLTAIVPGP